MSESYPREIRCPWCGQLSTLIWVHGHGQCRRCGTNIDECCRGEHGACGPDEKQIMKPRLHSNK